MLKIYIDASTKGNPGPSGGGFVIIGEQLHEQISFPLPESTNHQAEFAAFIALLNYLIAQQWQEQTIMVFTDSKVLAQTIEKNHTSNPKFKEFLFTCQQLLPKFNLLLLQWIPENQNKGADNLARQGLKKALALQNRRK